MQFGDERVPNRVWNKIAINADGCWLWTGALSDGYGMTIRYPRNAGISRNVGVHRWLLEVDTGIIGEQALHGPCHRRNCVNPQHLRWGNNSENQLDSVAEGTHTWASKTHCPQGHPYDQKNTYWLKRGARQCLTCKRKQDRVRARAYRERLKNG